jgi:hypothetical protein
LRLYADLEIATVPLRPRSKRPLRTEWQTPSTHAWANVPQSANVGVITGSASGGLVVLDFDDPELFHEVLGLSPRSLASHTIVVRTARGFHAYARHPGTATRVPREGFSILGDGSLAVAPPSVHPSGAVYTFVGEPKRIARLSEFAAEELLAVPEPATPEGPHQLAAGAPFEIQPILPEDAFKIVSAQNEKVVAAWKLLTSAPPSDRDFQDSGTDAWSRADFLIALCLIQHGCDPERVAAFLMVLPGSKAAARGWPYAMRTCARAAETARTGRLPGR